MEKKLEHDISKAIEREASRNPELVAPELTLNSFLEPHTVEGPQSTPMFVPNPQPVLPPRAIALNPELTVPVLPVVPSVQPPPTPILTDAQLPLLGVPDSRLDVHVENQIAKEIETQAVLGALGAAVVPPVLPDASEILVDAALTSALLDGPKSKEERRFEKKLEKKLEKALVSSVLGDDLLVSAERPFNCNPTTAEALSELEKFRLINDETTANLQRDGDGCANEKLIHRLRVEIERACELIRILQRREYNEDRSVEFVDSLLDGN